MQDKFFGFAFYAPSHTYQNIYFTWKSCYTGEVEEEWYHTEREMETEESEFIFWLTKKYGLKADRGDGRYFDTSDRYDTISEHFSGLAYER